MREFVLVFFTTLVLLPVALGGVHIVGAQVMQSSSYRIQSDSVNFGGGLSTSTNYNLESTGGEIATGPATSTSYNLFAGYQQMQETYIALTASTDITLLPVLGGLTGGTSNGSTTVTVTTDSAAGYQLTIQVEGDPAMQKEDDNFTNYAPTGEADFTFSTDTTEAHFGYSPEGVDIVQKFQDDGGACNTGTGDTELACWDGPSTTAETISQGSSANQPSGATTSIRFRVGMGASAVKTPGLYSATTTLTALAL